MKKLFYILGIGLLMASCTEDFKTWLDPQSNTENPKNATAVVTAAEPIDFSGVSTDSVQLFSPKYSIEDGVTVENLLYIFNEDKSESAEIATDEQGRVSAKDLRNLLERLYGVTEGTIIVPFNVTTMLTDNGETFTYATAEPLETAVTMAAGMYLSAGDNLMPMTVEGDHYTITVPAEEIRFYFVPFNKLSNVPEGRLGSDVATTGFLMGGNLVQGAEANEIFLEADPDFTQYVITANENDMTYNVDGLAYADMIWQAGNANGWGSPAAGLKNKGWKDARDNDGDYFGFMYLNGEFKFRSQETTWDAPDWGLGASEGTLAAQAGNIYADEGFYMVEANLATMTYQLTPITTIGVIGGFEDTPSWEHDEAALTYNTATGAWEGYCTIPAGVEFKFRANEDWAINWGGDMNNLSYDGGNLKVDNDGYYFIQLYIPYEGKFHVVMTPQMK